MNKPIVLLLSMMMITLASAGSSQRFSSYSSISKFDLETKKEKVGFNFYPFVEKSSFGYVLEEKGSSWIRLFFSQVHLPQGYLFRFISLTDGYQQNLTPETIRQWRNSTAFFNGGSIYIQCFKDQSKVNPLESDEKPLLVIDSIMTDKTGLGVEEEEEKPKEQSKLEQKESIMSICFDPDTRDFTNDTRQGRYIYDNPNGCCTAWMIDDDNFCFLSAGHCSDVGKGLVEFNVPLSAADGTLIHPDPKDQYIVDQESMQTKYNFESYNDWRYFGVFENSETGLTPIEAYGGRYYKLQRTREYPQPGTALRITGYGENESFPKEHRRVLKTAVGTFKTESDDWMLSYRVDTSNGNSGSAIYNIETGYAIGIHTLGGCSSFSAGSSNSGVDIFAPPLQNALANPLGVCQRKRQR